MDLERNTDFDFIDDIESIGVPSIGKIDLHQSIRQAITISCCTRKGVFEIGVRVLHSRVSTKDDESSDADTKRIL